jgi:hypothetical protein
MKTRDKRRLLQWVRATGWLLCLLLGTVAAEATSVGCTLYSNTAPRIDGFGNPRCLYSPGSSCYYCEYHITGGGFTVCSETPDQGTTWCVDYRDVPPFQVTLPSPIGEVLASLTLAAVPQGG